MPRSSTRDSSSQWHDELALASCLRASLWDRCWTHQAPIEKLCGKLTPTKCGDGLSQHIVIPAKEESSLKSLTLSLSKGSLKTSKNGSTGSP
jgi:hypothetical protein